MRRKTRAVTVGSGRWRGRVLTYPDDAVLRPTMSRTKHSLFSSLGLSLEAEVFVDCFAGAGGVGIEALSRGAVHVHFIEARGDAVEALRANLALCDAAPARYHVHQARAAEVLAREPNPAADATVIFADPPYDADLEGEFLAALDPRRFPRLARVVIEHRTRRSIQPPPGLRVERERAFGDTTLSYLVADRKEKAQP